MAAVTTVQEQDPHLHEGRTSFAAVATAVVLSRARTRRRENLRRSMSPVMPAEERREEAVLPETMQRKLKTVAKQARSTSRTRRKKRLTLSSDANGNTMHLILRLHLLWLGPGWYCVVFPWIHEYPEHMKLSYYPVLCAHMYSRVMCSVRLFYYHRKMFCKPLMVL